jgi:hypothetical protein
VVHGAIAQGLADAGAGDDLAVDQDRLHHTHVETALLARGAQVRHITLAVVPQGKVFAHPQAPEARILHQAVDEFGGRHVGHFAAERMGHRRIHAKLRQIFDFFLGCGEIERWPPAAQHHRGVRDEGDHDRRLARGVRFGHHLADERLVAAV